MKNELKKTNLKQPVSKDSRQLLIAGLMLITPLTVFTQVPGGAVEATYAPGFINMGVTDILQIETANGSAVYENNSENNDEKK